MIRPAFLAVALVLALAEGAVEESRAPAAVNGQPDRLPTSASRPMPCRMPTGRG